MKIVLVSNTYITKMSQDKPQALGNLVRDLVVLTPKTVRDTLGKLKLEIVDNPNFEIIGLRSTPAKHNSFRVYDPIQLHQIFTEHRPDVVCIEQEPYSLSTLQIISMKKMYGFKVVLLSSQNISKKYPPPFNLIEKFCLKRIDLFLGVSSSVLPVWIGKGMPREKCRVLPQVGVNTGDFKPIDGMKAKFGIKGFAVGYAGRFVEEKGIQVLVEAFALSEVSKAGKLVLIGRGPYKPVLDSMIERLRIREKVIFLEGIKHHEMPQVLNALDVLVLPSLISSHWKEQFGHIIIEAQACGVPVIGSNYDPIPETMGQGGLSFETGSVELLREKISKLFSDTAAYKDLQDKARQNVQTRFTNDVIAEQFLKLLAEELPKS